jgi:hypothetical protein
VRSSRIAAAAGHAPKRRRSSGIHVPSATVASTSGGLIRDRAPDQDNYGVYVYCNDRLIVKELKVRDVGYFVSAEAGVPHPDASLCRVLIEFHGPASLPPLSLYAAGSNPFFGIACVY